MSKIRVVLDANVLYGSFPRDLLLSLFAQGMYEAKWSAKIAQEWVGHLLNNRSDIPESAINRTLALMHKIEPSALVERYEHLIEQVQIPDKDDRHVVAAAIACGAQKILTWNLADFPNSVLAVFGVIAESPDKFISDLIIDDPTAVVAIFRGVRERMKAPPMSVDRFFEALKDSRLTLTAKHLERYHNLL